MTEPGTAAYGVSGRCKFEAPQPESADIVAVRRSLNVSEAQLDIRNYLEFPRFWSFKSLKMRDLI